LRHGRKTVVEWKLALFIRHSISGHFDPGMAVPIVLAGAVNGIIRAKIALKTKPENSYYFLLNQHLLSQL
jgi:hypothetical protein